ncbi:MAG: AMP-binding protein, partial [bacterium]|nr:AMP-binding protein [bacterium]
SLTRAKFNKDFKKELSALSASSAVKLYKTGDLARWLEDGNVEFLGRIDHQVKVRGFRIELGEIEARLLGHESVSETVVIDREDEQGEKYLCAYVVSEGAEMADSAEYSRYLSRTLPDHMIPTHFIPIEKIPITVRGKVNRSTLPAPGIGTMLRSNAYTPPRDRIERNLVDIWSDILHIAKESIGIDEK